MGKAWTGIGITVLLAFIGYGVFDLMGGRIPLLSYTHEAEQIVRVAETLVKLNKAAGVPEAELRDRAKEMREEFDTINKRCADEDRRRPSFPKLGAIVDQVEAAALHPEKKVIVTARLNKVEELVKELQAVLGSDQDRPQ